jgi:hypothetical protein
VIERLPRRNRLHRRASARLQPGDKGKEECGFSRCGTLKNFRNLTLLHTRKY